MNEKGLAEKFYLEPVKIGDTHTDRLERLLRKVYRMGHKVGFDEGVVTERFGCSRPVPTNKKRGER